MDDEDLAAAESLALEMTSYVDAVKFLRSETGGSLIVADFHATRLARENPNSALYKAAKAFGRIGGNGGNG